MAHHKSCFTVSDIVDKVVRLRNLIELTSAHLMKMVVVVLRIVGMKKKEVSINISLLFELSFNDFKGLISTVFQRVRVGTSGSIFPCFTIYCSVRAF